MKKFFKGLISVVLMVPILIGALAIKTVKAEDEISVNSANVTINKRVFENEGLPQAISNGTVEKRGMPNNIQNTGEEMSEFGGKPLNGVEFTVYNVTKKYYDLIKNSTQDAAIKAIQKDAEPVAPDYAVKMESLVTKGQGQAVFANLALKNEAGQYNVYLFVETKTPTHTTITKRAVPMVLAMPIYKLNEDHKPTDTINQEIHLYPKNETSKDTKILANEGSFNTVLVGNKEYTNVTTGDTLEYGLAVNLPANIGNKEAVSSFVIKDKPSAGLSLVEGTVIVRGLEEGQDYTISYANGGFKVTLNLDSEKVKSFAGEKLWIEYDMKLTAEVNPDDLLKNEAGVQINGDPEQEIETPPTPVVTGGYQFLKKDAQTGQGLAGAEFVVTNDKQTEFAIFTKNTKGEYVFSKWVDTKDEATRVVSSTDGRFAVFGLLDGTYVLNETKAPSENYVLLKDGTINFTVKYGTYGSSNLDVPNTPKGLLPSTGGTGIYVFLAMGAVLMVGAFIWYKKAKDTAEV